MKLILSPTDDHLIASVRASMPYPVARGPYTGAIATEDDETDDDEASTTNELRGLIRELEGERE